jgi:hypothetical protein
MREKIKAICPCCKHTGTIEPEEVEKNDLQIEEDGTVQLLCDPCWMFYSHPDTVVDWDD